MQLDPGDPRNSRTYMMILMVLMGATMLGALVAILGENVYQSEIMRRTGFGVALVSGAIYLFFRVWGRRKAQEAQVQRTRRELARDPDEDGDGEAAEPRERP